MQGKKCLEMVPPYLGWGVWLGNFGLGILASELWLGNFWLGSFGWEALAWELGAFQGSIKATFYIYLPKLNVSL